MPFSALYLLLTLLIVLAVFAYTYKKRGLKVAIISSGIAFGVLAAIFLLFLTAALNNM
jgi:membrane associated rhomboid family serine protease